MKPQRTPTTIRLITTLSCFLSITTPLITASKNVMTYRKIGFTIIPKAIKTRERLHRFSITPRFSSTTQEEEDRLTLLHNQLTLFNINATELSIASKQSLTTSRGYWSPQFGKSAIKTYNTYLKHKSSSNKEENPSVAAKRTALQIQHLIKHHKSKMTNWVRHTDDNLTTTTTNNNTKSVPITIVLDNLRSAFNVGSIFRSADACNIREIITVGITPHPYGNGMDQIQKSSLGTECLVPTRHFDTIMQVLADLKDDDDDAMLVGMETTQRSKCFWDVTYKPNTVLIVGNEVSGVDVEVLEEVVDEIVEIPMFGRKNSLNVAASVPVVLYEILRQWREKEGEE